MKNFFPSEPWRDAEAAEYDLPLKSPPVCILDIGANVGAFALRCAEKYPSATVFAYEPVPETFERLLAETDAFDNIRPFNFAVREMAGVAEMKAGDRDVTCSFYNLGRQTDKSIVVRIAAARDLPSCQLVKVDTEGCELEILTHLDLSQTLAVLCEYHRGDSEQIIRLMTSKGFLLAAAVDEKQPGYGILKFTKPGVLADESTNPPIHQSTNRKIYIALTGHYSSSDMLFVQSLCALIVAAPSRFQVGWNADPCIDRSRNVLAKNFLDSDCTHLLFIDSDIGFTPQNFVDIISHTELVVGGMYPLKRDKTHVEWCGNGLGRETAVRPDGLQEVRYIGTGFLCIAREALLKLIVTDPSLEYTSDEQGHRTEYAFFMEGIFSADGGRRRFLTEDWYFCQRWLDLGEKVYADTRVFLRHAGRGVWPLPMQAGNPFTPAIPSTNPPIH